MKLLTGKNVIITGASRGIGKCIAELFAKQGANIAFTCRKTNHKTSVLVDTLSNYGIKAKAYSSDASDFNASHDLVSHVIEDFGSIDVLVNNAGITKDNLLMRMSEEDFNDVM